MDRIVRVIGRIFGGVRVVIVQYASGAISVKIDRLNT